MFHFKTRLQRLCAMNGSSRTALNYLDQLQKFHHSQGTSFTRVPKLDHQSIDLLKFKKEVDKRGGMEAVRVY